MKKFRRVNGFNRRAEIPVSYLEELIQDRIELDNRNSFPKNANDLDYEQIRMLADSIAVRHPTIKDWRMSRFTEKEIPTIRVKGETNSEFTIGFGDHWLLCRVVLQIDKEDV